MYPTVFQGMSVSIEKGFDLKRTYFNERHEGLRVSGYRLSPISIGLPVGPDECRANSRA